MAVGMERMLRATHAQRRLRLHIARYDKTRDRADDGDRHDPRSYARHRESHRHLVPFVVRQPATSNYVYRCPNNFRAGELWALMG